MILKGNCQRGKKQLNLGVTKSLTTSDLVITTKKDLLAGVRKVRRIPGGVYVEVGDGEVLRPINLPRKSQGSELKKRHFRDTCISSTNKKGPRISPKP